MVNFWSNLFSFHFRGLFECCHDGHQGIETLFRRTEQLRGLFEFTAQNQPISRLMGQGICWFPLLWLVLNIFLSNEISITFVLIFQVKKSFFEHKRVSRLSSHHPKIETENLHCLVGAAWRKNRNSWCHEACWAQEIFLKY